MVGLVRIMFDRLKDLGIFHDSLIFVVADHGMWSSVAEVRIPEDIAMKHGSGLPVDRSHLPEQKCTALPLILVKQARSSEPLLLSDAPVALADIPKTIVSWRVHVSSRSRFMSGQESSVQYFQGKPCLFRTVQENHA